MKNKFILISDIHVDFAMLNWQILKDAALETDTLLVAGDISNDIHITMLWLTEAKSIFSNLLWVPGNHDFYNCGSHKTRLIDLKSYTPDPFTVAEICDFYQDKCNKHGINFLNRKTVNINGISFVGTTGWHDFIAGEPYSTEEQIAAWTRMNESKIRWNSNSYKIDHTGPLNQAYCDYEWMASTLATIDGPIVVVTHHIPHRKLVHQKPNDIEWTKTHGVFVNTQFEKIKSPNIKLWCYGHTHERIMKTLDNNITYVCNARGYYYEFNSYLPLILDLNDF